MAESWGDKLSPFFISVALIATYLVSRKLGKDIIYPLAIGVAIASLGVFLARIFGVWQDGNAYQLTGGLIFENNYDIIAGYVLLGMAVFIHRWRWILASLSIAALVATGSPEALFALAVLAVAILIRRDWSKKIIVVCVLLLVGVILAVGLGYWDSTYTYVKSVITFETTVREASAIQYRIDTIVEAMQNIKPLGTGYNLTNYDKTIVHNVPLIIIQQLGYFGVIAALAWLWVSIYCLVKTRLKYVWLIILSLALFDHYIWTQMAMWWWVVVGISTAGIVESDKIFKNG